MHYSVFKRFISFRTLFEGFNLLNNSSTMSETNGYTNGTTNGHNGYNSEPVGQHWTVGLLNSQCRYLTAESFGFKVNANGVGLKKKQLWTLEPYGDDDSVCLRSHLDRYLSVDHFGNVTCESEEKAEGAKFFVAVANDGTGRWALRNSVRGYFLGAANDKLLCSAKVPGPAELWTVHLAARPQVNIRSVGRRRYARLSTDHEAIHVDANTPWGEDTLFTLEFHDGKYAIHTCNDKYLRFDGTLSETLAPESLFTLEFHSGYLALRDSVGRYVAPLGSRAVLKTRSQTVTKDELFFLEDSVPQAAFVAFNGKYVSVKQGVDVTANQDEISDHEIFQLEYDIPSKKWCIRTMQDKYWSLQSSSGIQANADKGSTNSLFSLDWQDDGSVTFVANNGKCVVAKKSGHLYANGDSSDQDEARFYFYLINRRSLVLKCEQGFVGYKSHSNPKLECNKASYETIVVERDEKGLCFFKGSNGKYWNVCEDGTITVDSDVRHGFFIELREPSKLCIKTARGSYVMAEKNGTFKVNGASYDTATFWEY
ncbi:protein singed [Nephila pilipes]|uniref:Protein singed n=1 Tax=Nephila pilipes TaxID=299642 RepID=A0A8X6PC68_NEPPI|nr:protein singed [Nephila pilipes]